MAAATGIPRIYVRALYQWLDGHFWTILILRLNTAVEQLKSLLLEPVKANILVKK